MIPTEFLARVTFERCTKGKSYVTCIALYLVCYRNKRMVHRIIQPLTFSSYQFERTANHAKKSGGCDTGNRSLAEVYSGICSLKINFAFSSHVSQTSLYNNTYCICNLFVSVRGVRHAAT